MTETGIVKDDLFIEHDPGSWHPESPDRLREIYALLDRNKPPVTYLERREATQEEILRIHKPEHFQKVAQTEGKRKHMFDADTCASASSFHAAKAAAGGLISLTEKVLAGDLSNGFALVRPPGHHAEANRPMGFCLFNNIALASAAALGKGLKRILIVDWDLHHGNGTQHSFYDDPRVLYFSTHQFPHYPGTGAIGDTGRKEGLGYTINLPLSWGHGDQEYVAIFKTILWPVAKLFRPELILVSAGFDIHQGDPLGDMKVTHKGFAAMARILKDMADELCGGKLVFTLEGGYDVKGQAAGVEAVIEVLTGNGTVGSQTAAGDYPEPEIVARVRQIQSSFWKI